MNTGWKDCCMKTTALKNRPNLFFADHNLKFLYNAQVALASNTPACR
jgi:hypothetical protein